MYILEFIDIFLFYAKYEIQMIFSFLQKTKNFLNEKFKEIF